MSGGSSISAGKLQGMLALVIMMVVCITGGADAAPDRAVQETQADNSRVHVLHVRGNVYMLVEPTNNISVQVGDHYIIVVDTGLPELSDEVIATIQSLSSLPIMFLANTSADPDHQGGNTKLSKVGWALPNAGATGTNPEVSALLVTKLRLAPGATVVGHINTVDRLSDHQLTTDAISYHSEGFQLYSNEPVVFYYMPAAHTDGDTMVFFRGSDVLSVGDLFSTTRYPVIETEKGGTIDGTIDALNEIITLLVPRENEEGGTYVIPGHGHLSDRNDVVDYRDMVTIIRGRIQAMVKKGMTLEQVKAAKPTFDYDRIYGATAGPWTTDKFIEAVYAGVSKDKTQQAGKK
jgi:glyoxylase-like metal-dependent hydrolase (beta-lactamase superfamily II)